MGRVGGKGRKLYLNNNNKMFKKKPNLSNCKKKRKKKERKETGVAREQSGRTEGAVTANR